MERKEQTGHICRWMALGIMTAIVIVGCTIVIGLFEWRDRKEIEGPRGIVRGGQMPLPNQRQ